MNCIEIEEMSNTLERYQWILNETTYRKIVAMPITPTFTLSVCTEWKDCGTHTS